MYVISSHFYIIPPQLPRFQMFYALAIPGVHSVLEPSRYIWARYFKISKSQMISHR